MEINQNSWTEQDPWGSKEFIFLMLLEFIFVICFLKFIVSPMYSKWFNNELYAGTLMGVTIGITLMVGVYFISLRPRKLT